MQEPTGPVTSGSVRHAARHFPDAAPDATPGTCPDAGPDAGPGPLREAAESALAELQGALKGLGLPVSAMFDPVTAEASSYPLILLDRMNAESATALADALRHAAACAHD